MLRQVIQKYRAISADLHTSRLYDENTFYKAFLKDLAKCRKEVIIESPFVTSRRLDDIMPTLGKLKDRNVKIAVVTKDPRQQDISYIRDDALNALASLQYLGVQVVYVAGHHRKLAILDRKVLYEGSLNIFSQNNSREIMRRIQSAELACQMAGITRVDKLLSYR